MTPPEVAESRGKTDVAEFLRQFDTTRSEGPPRSIKTEAARATDGVSTALRALAFKEKAFGRDYHGLAPTLQKLAQAYKAAGDVIGNRQTLERAALLASKPTATSTRSRRPPTTTSGRPATAAASTTTPARPSPRRSRSPTRRGSGRAFHPAEPREAFDQVLVPLGNLALHTLQRGDIRQALPLLERVVSGVGNEISGALLTTILGSPNSPFDFHTGRVVADDAARPESEAGRPETRPSSTESFFAVDTTPVESVALVPALVTLSYAYLLDKNYEGCRRELVAAP